MKSLVLVDDSSDQIELMRLALGAMRIGWPIVSFCSGDECLAAIESGSTTPGLILLDVNMPGLDGPATVARIRRSALGRTVRIVMMSTSDEPSDVRRSLEAGANSYIMKPTADRSWSGVLSAVIEYWRHIDLGEAS